MVAVSNQYEADFRAAVEAAVRGAGKGDPAPELLDAITEAARGWVEDHGCTRYHEGRTDGWIDGQEAGREAGWNERDY